MTKEQKQYYSETLKAFEEIMNDNPQLDAAAEVIARSIAEGNLINVIGPGGHSNMVAEEVLWRAGSLAPVNPILDPGINVIHGAKRSNIIERTPGYAARVFESYRIGKKPREVIIIANSYGINAMTIDCVDEARKRGMTIIAITSRGISDNVPPGTPSRHPSNRNLYQEADYFIDTHMPYGDAVVDIDNFHQKLAPTSTLCNTFTINLLMLTAAVKLNEMGIEPPVWTSANLPGGDEKNKALEEKYIPLVKHL